LTGLGVAKAERPKSSLTYWKRKENGEKCAVRYIKKVEKT